MKKRNPGIVFLLLIVTLGIYGIVWHFKFQDELREESGKGILPVGHIMVMIFVPIGGIVYYIFWLCKVEGRLVLAGAPGKNRWWIHILLLITVVGTIFTPMILQSKANQIGSADAKQEEKKADLRTDKYAKYQTK